MTDAPLRLSSAFPFPERPRRFSAPVEDKLRQWVARLPAPPALFQRSRLRHIADGAGRLEDWAQAAVEDDAAAAAHRAGATLRRRPRSVAALSRLLALVRAASAATLGLRPYDVQMMGAAGLLDKRVVEMETGEGKSLAAALAAACAAASGKPVHVVTVNDYLAARDSKVFRPFFTALGLSVGLIVHDADRDGRRAAYAADVVYVTNKELTFDYLRDQLARQTWPNEAHRRLDRLAGQSGRAEATVMRGLHVAIIDEADSILIDEARTPLIISASGGEPFEAAVAEQALALAAGLAEGADFRVDRTARSIDLTDAGQRRIEEGAPALRTTWRDSTARLDIVHKALSALYLFERDVHYLVAEGKVQIIDEYTGRLMPDRFWNDGLHQLIEVKEGVALSDGRGVLARITYQRFFTRYQHLSGMSGTLRECASELREVYGLRMTRIATHRRSRRRFARPQIHATAAAKWQAVARLAQDLVAQGRPVLIGTRTVAASRRASEALASAGIANVVLSAAQDADEAEIVAQAGTAARVTIATNMAGRGTDIRLAPEVAARGGLAVILTERHEAARIDRQLAGRCGRQGEPGTVHVVLSLEDKLLDLFRGTWRGRWLVRVARLRRIWGLRLTDRAQRRSEQMHHQIRRELLHLEERVASALAFSGPPE